MDKPPTERRHPGTADLDLLELPALLAAIGVDDHRIVEAVAAARPSLVDAVRLAVASIRAGGRVHYVGAGSSGRYGVLDAAEIPPTYGLDCFVGHLAGGAAALVRSVENAEDDEAAGLAELSNVTRNDLVVGLAASGRTPYVGGAFRAARAAGAGTVLMSSNPRAPLAGLADVHVLLDTGPEVVMGSTRMKAGAALKIALHTFSTATMVQYGRTYSNLMVDTQANNVKIQARRRLMLAEATGADPEQCARAWEAAGGELRTAIVMLLVGCPADQARAALEASGGSIRGVLSIEDGSR